MRAEVCEKKILMLGMGRSGTSFLSEYLKLCGVWEGDVNWAHEHKGLRAINDSFLELNFGARPNRNPYGDLPDHTIECGPEWHQRAAALVEELDASATDAGATWWAIKDPRSTLLHTLWAPHADYLVGIFRLPQQVVASYLGKKWIRGWNKRGRALNYWIRFNRSLLEALERAGEKPEFLIDYNADVPGQCAVLSQRLGIVPTPEAAALFESSKLHYTQTTPMNPRCVPLYEELRKRALSAD